MTDIHSLLKLKSGLEQQLRLSQTNLRLIESEIDKSRMEHSERYAQGFIRPPEPSSRWNSVETNAWKKWDNFPAGAFTATDIQQMMLNGRVRRVGYSSISAL